MPGAEEEAAGRVERQQDVDLARGWGDGRLPRSAPDESLLHGPEGRNQRLLNQVPVFGDPVERFLSQTKDAIKAEMLGGMLFEELGFRYIGPVDGHDIRHLQKYLAKVRDFDDPVLLHVVTEKGRGFPPAEEDPVKFHTPAPFARENGTLVPLKRNAATSYTRLARDAICGAMERDHRVCVITAAMCQGNMLEPVRESFPDRFFDVGICESHAVAFAADWRKAACSGGRHLQHVLADYDRSLGNFPAKLPVVLMPTRRELTGPDGPTHHGVFDLGYLRPFPNLAVMAGRYRGLGPMLGWPFLDPRRSAIPNPPPSRSGGFPPRSPWQGGDGRDGRRRADHRLRNRWPIAIGPSTCSTRGAECRPDQRGSSSRSTRIRSGGNRDGAFIVTVEGHAGRQIRQHRTRSGTMQGWTTLRRLGIPDRFVEHDQAELLTGWAGRRGSPRPPLRREAETTAAPPADGEVRPVGALRSVPRLAGRRGRKRPAGDSADAPTGAHQGPRRRTLLENVRTVIILGFGGPKSSAK